jgi:hypothetical protein
MSLATGAPSGRDPEQRRLRFIHCLLVCAILLAPVTAALIWHGNNLGWPTDDAATYMRTAYDHYLALKAGSLADGLQSLYWQRGWRPIAFPLLAAPLLWAGDGNVLLAVSGVMVACLLAWAGYAYGVARFYLPPVTAALAAAFTCTTPALIGMVLVFYAEIPWLAACTAFVFHVLRADGLRHRWHAFGAGAALGIAMLMRPVETVVTLALPAAALLALAVRRGTIAPPEGTAAILQTTAVGGLLVAAAFLPGLDHRVLWPICGILAITAFALARRARSIGGAGLAILTATLLVLNAFWYADFMPRLYAWVHATSFGAMARITDVRMARVGYFGVLEQLQALYVGPLGIIAALTALLALAAEGFRRRSAPSSGRPWLLAAIALGALLPMLALYGWTGTSDPRRVMAGVALAALLIGVLALSDGAGRPLRIAVMSVVVAVQLLAFTASARSDPRTLALLAPLLRHVAPAPRTTPDPHPELVRQLIKAGVPRGGMVAAYTMGLHQGNRRVWEPFAAMVAAGAFGDPLALTYRWEVGDYDTALALYRRLGVGYILVEHFRDSDSRAIRQPYVEFTMALLDRIDAGEIHPPGLQLFARFEVGGRLNSVFRILP